LEAGGLFAARIERFACVREEGAELSECGGVSMETPAGFWGACAA
jgi:hypothetical protein